MSGRHGDGPAGAGRPSGCAPPPAGNVGRPNVPSAAGSATLTEPALDNADAETGTVTVAATGNVTVGNDQCDARSVSDGATGSG